MAENTGCEVIGERRVLTDSQIRAKKDTSESFFSGNYNWDWLYKAEQAKGLFVALHLLRLATMRRNDRVQFPAGRTASELDMARCTLYRKLASLQSAGLIKVDRMPRRWPTVELLGSPRVPYPKKKDLSGKSRSGAPPSLGKNDADPRMETQLNLGL
jgi:hypothetical protein